MCRLFGVLSREAGKVEHPLLLAPNALGPQSIKHPDGWGVAWYRGRDLHLRRGVDAAHASSEFARAVKQARSHAVLAHVRKASVGDVSVANTHPFSHQGWVFAHNGTVRGFDRRKAAFERRISPELRAQLKGDTDSERCFLLFLSELGSSTAGLEGAARALARTAWHCLEGHPSGEAKPTSATFMATNGEMLVAVRCGRELGYTAHRSTCSEAGAWSRKPCRCHPRTGSPLSSLAMSSEPTQAEHRWTRLRDGDVIGVEGGLALRRFRMEELVSRRRATG